MMELRQQLTLEEAAVKASEANATLQRLGLCTSPSHATGTVPDLAASFRISEEDDVVCGDPIELIEWQSKNQSGYFGVACTSEGVFEARIQHGDTTWELGSYNTAEEAARVVASEYLDMHGSPPTQEQVWQETQLEKYGTCFFD